MQISLDPFYLFMLRINITTNKTGIVVAARGCSVYLVTCEHEIAAFGLGEGWLLVSYAAQSTSLVPRLFSCRIYLALGRLNGLGIV